MSVKFGIAMTLILLCTVAQGGNERGNGGDVVVQPDGQVRFLDIVRKPNSVLLNIEDPHLAPALEAYLNSLVSLNDLTVFIGSESYLFKSALMKSVRSLKFYLVDGPLPETNDRGVVQLPWKGSGEKIHRLAYQLIQNRMVLIDRELFKLLPNSDQPSFLAHEGLIRLYHNDFGNPPLTTTEKISTLVHQLFQSTSLPPSMISQYLCDINIVSSEKALEGWRSMSGILTPQDYPEQIIVSFRDYLSHSCYAFHLKADPSRARRFRGDRYTVNDGIYTWFFNVMETPYKAELNLYFRPSVLEVMLDFHAYTDFGMVGLPGGLDQSKTKIWRKK